MKTDQEYDGCVMVREWREIPGYPGYEASDDGRVRKVVEMAFERHFADGRRTIRVRHEGGKRRRHLVSRLVCLAFHGEPPEEDMAASHLDGNEENDRPGNLRWESQEENNRRIPGHQREKKGQRRLR